MKQLKPISAGLKAAFLFALMLLPQVIEAQQYFNYTPKGDVIVCFRRPSNPSYDVVADFSNVLSFVRLPVGSVTNINVYTPNNLKDAYTNLTSIQWSVLATFPLTSVWSNYPPATIWFTVPRSDPATQTTPPARTSKNFNSTIRTPILSAGGYGGGGAVYVSSHVDAGSTNSDNDFQVVLEPVAGNDPEGLFTTYVYSGIVEDPSDDTIADFGGQLGFSVENTTGAPFSSAVVSDFYQSVPAEVGSVDPISGTTNGNAVYLGYFTMNTDGTMSFTRQTNSVTTPPSPPPPPVLSITRSGITSTISFTTTNGATYTLLYTNSAGIKQPESTWPTNTTTVTGDGTTKSFNDTTTDPNRVYGVSAH